MRGRSYRVRRSLLHAVALWLALILVACDGTPSRPGPIVPPPPSPGPQNPPANSAPTIESLTVQGTSRNQPPRYADANETVDVTAVVRDDETALEQLQYNWTATSGSFTGTGAKVSWRAPADVPSPTTVTLTLEVVERYGTNLEHKVTRTVDVALHNSAKEVGDMARQFLLDFSNTSLKDWRVVMRNFKESACPPSNEYANERDQVENHYTRFVMHTYTVGAANVTRNFGGACYDGVRGDACVSVPVSWDSTDTRTSKRATTTGIDHLTAAYSGGDSRWWLCSSRFQDPRALTDPGHSFYHR
jgi:hypothetical protein